MNVQAINEQIKALESQLKAAIEAERKALTERLAAIAREYEWRAVWKSAFRVKIERKLTDACIAAMTEAGETFANSFAATKEWHGMEHVVIGTHIFSSGGGHVVTSLPYGFNADPVDIGVDAVALLHVGSVPESIRATPRH